VVVRNPEPRAGRLVALRTTRGDPSCVCSVAAGRRCPARACVRLI
jgi:hypothetical protein